MGERLPVGKRSRQQSVTNDQRQIAHCGRGEESSKKVKSGEPCGVEVQLKTAGSHSFLLTHMGEINTAVDIWVSLHDHRTQSTVYITSL